MTAEQDASRPATASASTDDDALERTAQAMWDGDGQGPAVPWDLATPQERARYLGFARVAERKLRVRGVLGAAPASTDDCPHLSWSGDEGPLADLPGGLGAVVRWRCDECRAVRYDDATLDRLRAELRMLGAAPAAEAASTGQPPHLEHEWSCLTEQERADVLRWARGAAEAAPTGITVERDGAGWNASQGVTAWVSDSWPDDEVLKYASACERDARLYRAVLAARAEGR